LAVDDDQVDRVVKAIIELRARESATVKYSWRAGRALRIRTGETRSRAL
jgi:nitrogen regulatory protein PII